MRALHEGEVARLRSLPWGVGAAFQQGPDVPSMGTPGVFFACRTTGGQRYWRYVETDGDLLTEDAVMLRRINPGTAPGSELPAGGPTLESAWHQAAESIVAEHNRRADPRFEQERIGPSQRNALAILRDPAVALPAGAAEAEEALSVERGPLIRRALSDVARLLSEAQIDRDEAARRIVGVVVEFGLQSVDPPPPLEPMTPDELGVVCWMAVLPPN